MSRREFESAKMYNLVCVERIESILGIIFSSLMLHEDQMQDDDADEAPTKATMSQKEKQPPWIESLKTVIVWYLPVIMGDTRPDTRLKIFGAYKVSRR